MVTLEVIEERVNNTYKLLENIAEDNRQSHKEIIENFDKKYAEIKDSYEKLTNHVNHRNDTICKDLNFLNTELLKISQKITEIDENKSKIKIIKNEVEKLKDRDLIEKNRSIGRKELFKWVGGFFGLGVSLFTLLELLKTFILGCI